MHHINMYFSQIDQNRDGFIDKEDLHDMLASLGKDPTDEYLEAMMNEAPGLVSHIYEYEDIINRWINICEWEPK